MNTVKTNISIPLSHTDTATTPSSFRLDIHFDGSLPAGIPNSKLALEAFITIPSNLARWITPVVQVTPLEDQPADDPMERNSTDSLSYITFLPLAHDFDFLKKADWVKLVADIQEWIVDVAVDAKSPEHSWGADMFWMAYFCAYPLFPAGQIGQWDVRIKFFGTAFDRLAESATLFSHLHADTCSDTCAGCMRLRRMIWDEFLCYASLMYRNGPIVV